MVFLLRSVAGVERKHAGSVGGHVRVAALVLALVGRRGRAGAGVGRVRRRAARGRAGPLERRDRRRGRLLRLADERRVDRANTALTRGADIPPTALVEPALTD